MCHPIVAGVFVQSCKPPDQVLKICRVPVKHATNIQRGTINLKIETQLVIAAGQAVALRRLAIAARNRTALAPKNAPKTIERASTRFVFCTCVIETLVKVIA